MPKRKARAVMSDQASNNYLRLRSLQACGECRRRKRKCDGQVPCSSCTGYGYSCTFDNSAASSASSVNPSSQDWYRGEGQVLADLAESSLGASCPEQSKNQQLPPDTSTIVAKQNTRAVSVYSAVVLPHLLGHELNDPSPPRFHSYGWNLGLRNERRSQFVSKLPSYICIEDCVSLCNAYFATVHLLFGFLEKTAFLQRVHAKWALLNEDPAFEAVICGVIALGSFFSNPSHPCESNFVNQCLSNLDMALVEPYASLNMDFLAGWILRTVYLRLTTRPYFACIASHTTMHVAEILGLHRDLTLQSMATSSDDSQMDQTEIVLRRRHFWVAWSLNCILVAEYGLTPVNLPFINCGSFPNESSTFTDRIVSLAQILKDACDDIRNTVDHSKIEDHLHQIKGSQDETASLAVFRADVCLCILRRMLPSRSLAQIPGSGLVVSILQNALDRIPELVAKKHPWWNTLSVPFQTVCVCLWLNSPLILPILPKAIGVLKLVAQTYDSHMAMEAWSTAKSLIRAARNYDYSKMTFKDMALSDSDPTLEEINIEQLFPTGIDHLEQWLQIPSASADFI